MIRRTVPMITLILVRVTKRIKAPPDRGKIFPHQSRQLFRRRNVIDRVRAKKMNISKI